MSVPWDTRTVPLPRGLTIILGVEGEHDDPDAQFVLDQVVAWMMTHPGMPLLPGDMKEDCLVSPPERGSRHFEIRWIVV